MRLRDLALVGAWIGVVGGCGGPRPDPTARDGVTEVVTEVPTEVDTPALPSHPEALSPLLSVSGSDRTGVRAIVVQLDRPVFPQRQVGHAPDAGTALQVVPEVDGALQVTSPSTLQFTPRTGFAPDTVYAMTLGGLAVGDATLSSEDWRGSFTTPPLAFTGLGLTQLRPDGGEATLAMQFSGPIRAEDVEQRLQVYRDEVPVSARIHPKGKDVVHLVVDGIDPEQPTELQVALRAGVRSRVDPDVAAPGALHNLTVHPASPVTVHDIRLREGSNAFTLEVLCDDAAAEGSRRYLYDQPTRRSYRLSPRCLPDTDSALEHIRLQPAVPFTLAATRGGFRIHAELTRGPVSVTLGGGLTTVDGGVLAGTEHADLVVPALAPRVAFASKGRYLPADGWGPVGVQHRNVSEVEVTVRHVPDRNLVFWLTGDSERAGPRTADRVAQAPIPVRGAPDTLQTTFLDLSTLVPDPAPGLYEITVSAGGATDALRVLRTDLALIAKVPDADGPAPASMQVWTTGLRDAAPRSGVQVEVIRPSGSVLGACTTDRTGGCRLDLPDPAAEDDPAPPVALIARQGADRTYLKFSELKLQASADLSGEGWADAPAWRALLYTPRGAWRPGETAHLAGLIRDGAHTAPDAGLPVDLVLRDPRGQAVRQAEVRTDAAGVVQWPISFSDSASTGRWRVEAKIGDRPVGAVDLHVEDFVPERLEVDVEVAGADHALEDRARVEVEARYLFGGSAAGARFELTCRLQPAAFSPAHNAGYTYGQPAEDRTPVLLGTVSGTLDEDGRGGLPCPAGALAGRWPYAGALLAEVAVFEGGSGRTTVRHARAAVHPDAHYLGLTTGTEQAKAGQPLVVEGIAVDWAGQRTAEVERVEVQLVRLESEWGWRLDPERGQERWMRYLREIPGTPETVEVRNGRFTWSVTPTEDAEAWEIRARAGQAQTRLRVEGAGRWWRWRSGGDQDVTPRPLKPTSLALQVPETARVGQPVEVSFTAPYAGRALMTVETGEVEHQEWVDVQPGEVRWTVRLDRFVPNAWISALLVKDPHAEGAQAFLPDRAYGVASVPVEPEAFALPVTVTAPDTVRARAPFEVEVDLGPVKGPATVTVAVVDEGILSLTGHRTPDPLRALFPRRKLGVTTYETVGWAVHLPGAGPSSVHGGDAEAGPPPRVHMVKPVSLWSGPVEVGPEGKVTVPFELPAYQGRVRVMVVAATPSRVGAASTTMTVRDPLVLQTTLPRFLVEGDEVEIPVFLTNLSGEDREVALSLQARWLDRPGLQEGPPLEVLGADQAVLRLADGAQTTAVFRVRTRARTGAATLEVTARSGALVSTERLDIPFESAGPRTRRTEQITLTAGALDLGPYLDGWEPGTEETTLWVTDNPYGRAFTHLRHLIRYPYGCIEQTSSQTRPLLYVSDLLGLADPELASRGEVDRRVEHGIERILGMQTPSGGFAYWPGNTAPDAWGTAYASHLLLDAREQGYQVSEVALQRALSWLDRTVQTRNDRYVDLHQGTPSGEGYMLYVLARAGIHRKARAQRLLTALGEPADGAAKEEAYLLKAALYLGGDRRYQDDLRSPDASPIDRSDRRNDARYYSDLRRRGFLLSVYQDLFGSDPGAEDLARRVADGLAEVRSASYSTQELVWGITGLGKRLAGRTGAFDATLRVGGRALPPEGGDGARQRIWSVWRASERQAPTLEVQPADGVEVHAILTSTGVRQDAQWALGGEGLSVRRELVDADGRPVEPDALALGDLVYVRLQVGNETGDRIRNLVLVDRVPAGFEIENFRLGRGSVDGVADPDRLWTTDHMDLRDDRLAVFGALGPGEQRQVVYAVRAVTAGTFTLPPVEVEAMYDPSAWARQAGGTVVIRGPWEGWYL